MIDRETIRVVSFDVGETLLRPYPGFGEVVVTCCRTAGADVASEAGSRLEALAERYFARLRASGTTFSPSEERSRATWLGLYRQFLEAEGIAPDRVGDLAQRIYATFLDHQTYRLFDDALPVLTECRARGYRIGVTSNWEAWLTGLLEAAGISPLLDFAVISGVVGFEKPDRRIFDATRVAAGAAPEAILHVGDSLASDVWGATAAGLQAVLLDRSDRVRSAEVDRITSLVDLLDLLPELPPGVRVVRSDGRARSSERSGGGAGGNREASGDAG